jgi:hypothetical protein
MRGTNINWDQPNISRTADVDDDNFIRLRDAIPYMIILP